MPVSEYEAKIIFRPRCFLIRKGHEETEIDQNNFIRYLDNEVKVEKGTTLRQVMTVVSQNKKFTAFLSDLIKFPLKPFHDRLRYTHPKSKEIKKLEVSWYFGIFDDDKNVDRGFQFVGLGKGSKDKCTRYGVGPGIDDILDLPVTIQKKSEVYVQHGFTSKTYEKYEKLARITLLEFLRTIYFEISWFGTPKDGKEFSKEMDERLENLEEAIPYKEVMRYWNLDTKVRKLIRTNFKETWAEVKAMVLSSFPEKYLSYLDPDDWKWFHRLWMLENLRRVLLLVEEEKCSFYNQNSFLNVLGVKNA
jgi:hypothetical protein